MKITEEIFLVGGGGLTSPADAAIYLIHFGDEAALVDAGCGGAEERLFANIRDCGVEPGQIRYLLITHCHYDHIGGIPGIRDRTACRVVAHELDARYLEKGDDVVTAAGWYGASIDPITVDLKWGGGRTELDLAGRKITALHTPGHSPGSAVYLAESEGLKVLFGQDVHGPLDASLLSNREDYIRSLRMLAALEADILCEGHYGVIRGKEEVRKFIESFL
ncbi:MAG: MBL fold metallo-hydrolase [Deltaproteobacteria bacterium]|nr:MBL fold metallo-hydrolase [Deltaproteobacteria bacterium]